MIQRYLKHEMVKNLSVVMLGGIIAQAIAAMTPLLLTLYYSPEQFGIVSLITSIISVSLAVSNLGYRTPINIADSDRDSYVLTHICLLIGLVSSILIFGIILIFYFLPSQNIVNKTGLSIFLCIPVWVFFGNYFYSSRDQLARHKKFKTLSLTNIFKSIIVSSLQIAAGLLYPKAILLIIAKVIGEAFASIMMKKNITKQDKITKHEIFSILAKYKDITIYSLPITILEILSRHIITFFISYSYSIAIVGLYSIASKLIQMPITVISESMQKVFEQRSNKYSDNDKNLYTFTLRTVALLSLIGLPLFLTFFFFSEQLITYFLKEEWAPTAIYVKWLSPILLFQLVYQPFNSLFKIKRKVAVQLKFEFFEAVTKIGSIIILSNWLDVVQIVQVYTFGGIFFIIIKAVYIKRLF